MYVRIPRIENDIYSNWPEGATLNEIKKVNTVNSYVAYDNFLCNGGWTLSMCTGQSSLDIENKLDQAYGPVSILSRNSVEYVVISNKY